VHRTRGEDLTKIRLLQRPQGGRSRAETNLHRCHRRGGAGGTPAVLPFLEYPSEIRRAIYTTNAIESLNYNLRRLTKNRLSLPTPEAAMKLVFMATQHISAKWTMPIPKWGQALNYLAIKFEGRVPV